MAGPDPMLPAMAVVDRIRRETADTHTLEVSSVEGDRATTFAPGQFSMLYAFGVGEAPISISGGPEDGTRLAYTIRAVGPVTRRLVATKAGEAIGIRGPYGRGWPVDAARDRDLLVVAGGIGLAPLRSVVHHVLAHRSDYRRVALLYGARTPDDVLYRREVERWQRRSRLEVFVTVDRADLEWTGAVGVVTQLFSRATFEPARTVVMSCGPEVMMRTAARELERIGVGSDDIHVSMERNMTCAVGVCGHCQFGPEFICKDGPVLPYSRVRHALGIREL